MKQYYWALVKKDEPNEIVTIGYRVAIYTSRASARKAKNNNEKVVKITWSIVNEK